MKHILLTAAVTTALMNVGPSASRAGLPYEGETFKGRIAYSADGNHNDPDDWAASPVALAIFAECGLKDRLVHFHYNCILPQTNPEWEAIHSESVLGTAERYGFDRSLFYDCRKDLDGTIAAIAKAVNESSTDNPLYFIVAGPMQVPVMGLLKANPDKLQYVYCISHSRWNDGFSKYSYTHTKRDVIATGVNWVQIADQNRLLSVSPYGRPAREDEWTPYLWMRDSKDSKVQWLWDRLRISTRPDPSDAGMAYFVATGDEQCDPAKLRRLLDDKQRPQPVSVRKVIRIEAENFRRLEGFEVEDKNDRTASHRLQVRLTEPAGRIGTSFSEPYAAASGRFDIAVRYFDGDRQTSRYTFLLNGVAHGQPWKALGTGAGWTTTTIPGVEIKTGDQIEITVEGRPARLDYVELQSLAQAPTAAAVEQPTAIGPLDDPAALPGQIIVTGSRPGYLKLNGGPPVFLCGPDNPEEFLFLGELNADGTRTGPQDEIIEFLGQAGVNAMHMQMFRMQRCNIKNEGDDTHCPFTNFDPAQPLNEKILDQWDGWLAALEAKGIIVHLEFYNDATDVERMGWTLDGEGNLHPHERRWIEGIVRRFKHHKNILWGLEESANKLPRGHVAHFKKMAQLIAETDNHHHPIVQSFVTPDTAERDLHPDGVMSTDYRDDPHIDLVTWLHVAPHGKDVEAQHRAYLKWAAKDNDRFIPMKNETEYHRIDRTTARRQAWACVLTGMHALESSHNATRRDGRERIVDDGKIVSFIRQTDWVTMKPHDELAAGSTKWVLAGPQSCIAYSYDATDPMGVKNLPAGTYDLLWFDTVSGNQVLQMGITVSGGESTWSKPASIGDEVALYVRRQP